MAMSCGGVMLSGGCLDRSQRQQIEESGSILAVLGPPTPAQAAAMMVDPYSPDKRFKGMTLIANAPWGGADAYLAVYRDAIVNDSDMGVRGVAARALGQHGSPADAKLITPLLKSDDARVKLDAAHALQRLHNPEVVGDMLPLLDQTKEYDKDVRQAVASGLGQYADGKVVRALAMALNDDALSVSRTARQSLRTLTGEDLGDDSKAWLKWADGAGTGMFAKQMTYIYPAFARGKYVWEYIPLYPPPPNEIAASPAGYRPPTSPTIDTTKP